MRKSSVFTIVTAALVAGAGLVAGEARAQEGGAEAGAGAADNPLQITVTTQKREQRLAEVPIAISAFSGEDLDALGIDKFDEFSDFVPGLQIQEQSANNPAFVIRGITSDSGEATTEPRVAIFQDGVSLSRSRGSYVELFDLERIEVAKGPQATLFGRSALIGGIDIIQNKAGYEPEAIGDVTVGNQEQFEALGVLNFPVLEDKLAVRLAGKWREREGFVENVDEDGPAGTLGDTEVGAARLAVRFDPTSTLRFDLIGNYQDDTASGTPFVANRIADETGDTEPFEDASLGTFGGFLSDRPLGLERTVQGLTLLGDWQITDAYSLSSITGARRFESLEVFDPDGSKLDLFVFGEDATGDQFSQEFRLNFDNGGRLNWFAGVSYFKEEGTQRVPVQYDERLSLALLSGQLQPTFPGADTTVLLNPATQAALIQGLSDPDGPLGPAAPLVGGATAAGIAANLSPAYREFFQNTGETESFDAYVDATFQVTSKFEVSAGFRYIYDDKTAGFLADGDRSEGVERSVLGAYFGAVQGLAAGLLTPAEFLQLAGALAVPGAASIPASLAFPVPNFGLQFQPTGGTQEASDSFDAVVWRLVGRYALSDTTNLWASYARGRRPEVITANDSPLRAPGEPVAFETLPAEMVDSFEVGANTRLLNDSVALSGSVFYYNYSDFQTSEFQGGQLVTVTAGDASSIGFEGEATWIVTPNIEVFGNYAFNESRFDSGAREDNSFRLSPDHKFAVGAFLTYPISLGEMFLTPTYTWRSETFFDDDNDRTDLQTDRFIPGLPFLDDAVVDEVQDSYGVLNLRGGLAMTADTLPVNFTVEGFVENALDEDYIIDAGNSGDLFGLPTFIRGPGRLFGVRLSAKR